MKKICSVLLAAVLLLTCVGVVACQNNNGKVYVYLHGYDQTDQPKRLLYNHNADLPTPTRQGYTFDGWFTDEQATQPFAQHTPMGESFHLYAKWTEVQQVMCTVTLVFNDGATPNDVLSVQQGSAAPVPTPNRTGYLFDGWFTDSACTLQYTGALITEDITLYAKWSQPTGKHTEHMFESYFAFGKCLYADCSVIGRKTGTRNYDDKYNYNTTKANQIDAHYEDCIAAINNNNVNDFIDAFEIYDEDLNYLDEQYYWASLYYDYKGLDYQKVQTDYNKHFGNYYDLFLKVDESKLANRFWAWYGDDREDVLYWAELYSVGTDFGANDLLDEYYDLINDRYASVDDFNELYARLVEVNNTEAKHYGYSNYSDYAYETVYNREYTPAQVQQVHSYIKQYIAPALVKVNDALQATNIFGENKTFYSALMEDSIVGSFPNRDAVGYIADYFSWLQYNGSESRPIDFHAAVEDMFATGKYFSGSGEGAYTMWIPAAEMAAVYVQKNRESTYGYDTAFTFVHEFGHYYENVHNKGLSLSYDHDETQSQGDEMLFLAWLKENKPNGITTGMQTVELEELADLLWTICMSSAVDELEQAAYSGTYNGRAAGSDYHTLFGTILDSYGNASQVLKENGNDEYWLGVVFDNAAYYISYAMSALPSIELYTVAEEKDVQEARSTYFKLFTYCESETRMSNYSYTGSGGVLEFCGLDTPFQSSLYTHISNYVNQLTGGNQQ